MTWTFLAIIAIAIIASFAFVGVRFGLLERRPITYTPKQRLAWAVAMAAIPLLGGVYWPVGIGLGMAVYFSGPEYYQYRINRHPARHVG